MTVRTTTRRARHLLWPRAMLGAGLLALALLAHAATMVAHGQQPSAAMLPVQRGPLTQTDADLPDATVGSPYNVSVAMAGGVLPYILLISGNLPAGVLAVSGGGTVALTGVPTTAGSYELRVTVTDDTGATRSRAYAFNAVPISNANAIVTDTEGFHFTDADSVFFPAKVADPEGFTFHDADSVFFPDKTLDAEGIHFGDSAMVMVSAMTNDPEAFHFGDTDVVVGKVGVSPAIAPAGTYNTIYGQTFTAVGNTGSAILTPSGTVPGLSFSTSGTTSSTSLSGFPTTPGTYTFTITAKDTANTDVVSYSITINQASQTITVGTLPTPTYGGPAFSLTGDIMATSGLTPAIALNSGPATGSGFGPYTATGAGSVSYTATQAGNTNYLAATPVNFSVTVAKATLAVNATSATRAFDQPNPSFGYSFGTFVNGDNASVVSGAPVLSTTATPLSPVSGSPYTIVIGQGTLSASNYSFSLNAAALTVTQAAQSITFYPLPTLLTGSTFPLTARAGSGLAVSYSVSGGSIANNVLTVTALSGGTVTVTAAQTGNSNYKAATSVVRSFTAP